MNSCFEKLVDFKVIMSDRPDRIVALKKIIYFFLNSIKTTRKSTMFSYFIKL